MKLARIAVPVLASLALAAVGCNRPSVDRDRPTVDVQTDRSGTTTVTGAYVGSVGSTLAVGRIVAARCAREATCNNVGPDKHWNTGSTCTEKVAGDMKNDLNATDCPYGFDEKELNECLSAIRGEACNNPIDTISRLAACRSSDMCMKSAR